MSKLTASSEQFENGMRQFDQDLRSSNEWIDWDKRWNQKYAIRHNGALYPVKQVLSLATGVPTSEFYGGPEANDVVISLGYQIIDIQNGPKAEIDVEFALQSLILADADLNRLEDGLSEFNVFEAVGAVRSELRHSDFLAFLLDPSENHGLRDLFLKRFAQRAAMGESVQKPTISALQLGVWDLHDSSVEREVDGIDILILSAANRLVIAIENKVDSYEHSDQLDRYFNRVRSRFPDHQTLFLYLTIEGEAPSHPCYVAISYVTICEIVEDILKSRGGGLSPDVQAALRHYVRLLRRHFMDQDELSLLAQKFYRVHKRALDYIFEKRPDLQLSIKEKLERLIGKCPGLVLDDSSKSYTKFAPCEWYAGDLIKGEGWTESKCILLFEFRNSKDRIGLSLIIGPGDATVRQRLFDFALDRQPPFKLGGKTLYTKWTQVWSRKLVTTGELESEDLEAVVSKLEAAWCQFIKTDLEAIKSAVNTFLSEQRTLQSP